MKNPIKKMSFIALALLSISSFSQNKISGQVFSKENNKPISTIQIFVDDSDFPVTSNTDGTFTVTTKLREGNLSFDSIGYEYYTKSFEFTSGNTINLGKIYLNVQEEGLDELVIMAQGVIDVAEGRKTPIAVSTISKSEIEDKAGTGDVTTVMQNTPSVYVANQASGFGDSKIYTRGFGQSNTAFLLNGQPINGMENGKMYWSNWSGMNDVANAIQIQRGLGSSKLAISSVGGTVNFVTKATDMQAGGFVKTMVANNNFFKTTASYSTGLLENGWGVTALVSNWQGDGYNDMTAGQGQTYFFSLGYKPNEKHNLNFLVTGAPQWHDHNYAQDIATYTKYGVKHNGNWGYLNGEKVNDRRNYYHKPVMNLNWDWNIDEVSSLSTVVYASVGRGGGTRPVGKSIGRDSETGLKNFQDTYDANVANLNNTTDPDQSGKAVSAITSSVNNHLWYGIVTNYNRDITENISFNVGADLRSYSGEHFRQMNDLMGADYYLDKRRLSAPNQKISSIFEANPWSALTNYAKEPNERMTWDYSEVINYGGLFAQLEYANDSFSAFFQGSLSNQSHQRTDVYQYKEDEQVSEKVVNLGYNTKAGVSYTITENHQLFANAGAYSRQPFHENIYMNYGNEINPFTENEEILGLELGYKFATRFFKLNLNAYHTDWGNRVKTRTQLVSDGNAYGLDDGALIYKITRGVTQSHKGLELDFTSSPMYGLEVRGFASVGDWKYKGSATRQVTDEDRNILDETETDLDGGEVGKSAQTVAGLGFNYKITGSLSIDADYRYYQDIYSNEELKENVMLPSYQLVDAGLSYGLYLYDDVKLTFRGNVNNLFNTRYMSQINKAQKVDETTEATYQGLDVRNQVLFGLGRTWNVSAKLSF